MNAGPCHAEVTGDLRERQTGLAHRHHLLTSALHQTIIMVPSLGHLRFCDFHTPTLTHPKNIRKWACIGGLTILPNRCIVSVDQISKGGSTMNVSKPYRTDYGWTARAESMYGLVLVPLPFTPLATYEQVAAHLKALGHKIVEVVRDL